MFTSENKLRLPLYFVFAVISIVALEIALQSYALGKDTDAMWEQKEFDGNWWMKADLDERIGFLYALDDCLTFDANPAIGFDDSWINYEKKISGYYDASSSRLSISIQSVFEDLGKRGPLVQVARSRERYGDEFWRANDEITRRGFVEGYLSCRTHQKGALKWSRSVAVYVQNLDDIYNADDRHGEDAPEYAGSIASALENIADPQK